MTIGTPTTSSPLSTPLLSTPSPTTASALPTTTTDTVPSAADILSALSELVASSPTSTPEHSEGFNPTSESSASSQIPDLDSISTEHDLIQSDNMSHILQNSAGASGGGIDVSRMQGSLEDRIILVTHRLGQLKSQVTAQNALLAEKDVLLAERKDLLNERKIQLLELKQENKGLKDELRDVKDQLRTVNDQLRGANEDRRILQMQNVILQRDVQVQMNNIHLIMQGKEPVSDDKPEKKEASQNAHGAPATKQRTPASKTSTPQRTQTSTQSDPDVTPTPTKATLARTNMSFTSPSKESMMSTALVPTSPSRNTTTTSASTPRSISKMNSTTFTPGLPSTSPLIAHGSNPILRERASYQTGRSEDPFQNTVSRQPSMMSLNSQSSSSNENLRTTYPKNTRPTSKALASSNWRQPQQQQQQQQQQQRNPVPEPASLEDIRTSFAQLLAKIEIWADFYTGTMHTSVRAKEPKTADMVKTLGSLLGNFDMEKVFNKLETRTLLVTSWINRTVLCILFDDNLPEKFLTGDMLARFKELSVLESSTPAHDPARHRDLLTEKAEIVRAAVSAEVPGGWRDAESRKMAAEVCGLLSPIVPTGERAGGCREMAELVGEAVHVACAMRCLPARAWHLAFDVAGARVNTSSMSIRGPIVQGRGEGAGAAVTAAAAAGASLEEDHAVVLGVTPHLVSKLWMPGGVAPEELLKAEVLVAAVGRAFFMHH